MCCMLLTHNYLYTVKQNSFLVNNTCCINSSNIRFDLISRNQANIMIYKCKVVKLCKYKLSYVNFFWNQIAIPFNII
jgi:hypothetical protein